MTSSDDIALHILMVLTAWLFLFVLALTWDIQSGKFQGVVHTLNRADRALVKTTLVAPCLWLAVSLLSILIVEILLFLEGHAFQQKWAMPLRYIAATSTCCPLMAVLGARRPHQLAWQFVVGSLWGILASPALEAIVLGRPSSLDISPLRGWFLWLLIGLGLVNYVPTRNWAAAMVMAGAQVALLGRWLPGLGGLGVNPSVITHVVLLFFLGLVVIAYILPFLALRHRNRDRRPSELDARWLSFRDRFGALWALRTLERVNATARASHWPMLLGWWGFYFHEPKFNWDNLPKPIRNELQQTMDNLLRRFEALPESAAASEVADPQNSRAARY
jgi:hypothetical protein